MGKKEIVLEHLNVNKGGLVDELTKPPLRPKKGNPSWNINNIEENQYHQADLLFVPKDRGYRYILVVIDINTKRLQARPLKKKDGKEVLKQIKSIYGKGKNTLKKPYIFHVDAGTEFNETISYLKEQNVMSRRAAANRHSQQSIVEAANKIIGGIILGLELNEELRTKEISTIWVDYLPVIVREINKEVDKRLLERKPPKKKKKKKNMLPICEGLSCKILPNGTLVRVALDRNINAVSNKPEDAKFRTGDIRWSKKPAKVLEHLLLPNRPVRYAVEGYKNNTFARYQLKVFEQFNQTAK